MKQITRPSKSKSRRLRRQKLSFQTLIQPKLNHIQLKLLNSSDFNNSLLSSLDQKQKSDCQVPKKFNLQQKCQTQCLSIQDKLQPLTPLQLQEKVELLCENFNALVFEQSKLNQTKNIFGKKATHELFNQISKQIFQQLGLNKSANILVYMFRQRSRSQQKGLANYARDQVQVQNRNYISNIQIHSREQNQNTNIQISENQISRLMHSNQGGNNSIENYQQNKSEEDEDESLKRNQKKDPAKTKTKGIGKFKNQKQNQDKSKNKSDNHSYSNNFRHTNNNNLNNFRNLSNQFSLYNQNLSKNQKIDLKRNGLYDEVNGNIKKNQQIQSQQKVTSNNITFNQGSIRSSELQTIHEPIKPTFSLSNYFNKKRKKQGKNINKEQRVVPSQQPYIFGFRKAKDDVGFHNKTSPFETLQQAQTEPNKINIETQLNENHHFNTMNNSQNSNNFFNRTNLKSNIILNSNGRDTGFIQINRLSNQNDLALKLDSYPTFQLISDPIQSRQLQTGHMLHQNQRSQFNRLENIQNYKIGRTYSFSDIDHKTNQQPIGLNKAVQFYQSKNIDQNNKIQNNTANFSRLSNICDRDLQSYANNGQKTNQQIGQMKNNLFGQNVSNVNNQFNGTYLKTSLNSNSYNQNENQPFISLFSSQSRDLIQKSLLFQNNNWINSQIIQFRNFGNSVLNLTNQQTFIPDKKQSNDNIQVVTNQNFQSLTWNQLLKGFKFELKQIIKELFDQMEITQTLIKDLEPIFNQKFLEAQIINKINSCQYVRQNNEAKKVHYIDPKNQQKLKSDLNVFKSKNVKTQGQLLKIVQTFIYSCSLIVESSNYKFTSVNQYLQKAEYRQSALYKIIKILQSSIDQIQYPQKNYYVPLQQQQTNIQPQPLIVRILQDVNRLQRQFDEITNVNVDQLQNSLSQFGLEEDLEVRRKQKIVNLGQRQDKQIKDQDHFIKNVHNLQKMLNYVLTQVQLMDSNLQAFICHNDPYYDN